MLDIELVPCRTDNYAVLVHDAAQNMTVVVDAPEGNAIHAILEKRGWRATHILITHHHHDHIAGLESLCARYGPDVIAPTDELLSNTHITRRVRDGDILSLNGHAVTVIGTPGHTAGHVSYYWPQDALLFAGDTLFSLGCGRALECEPALLWHALKKLRTLPDSTALYCGHEYTRANARFALSVDGQNRDLAERAEEAERQQAAGRPTVPSRLGDEKRINPFLRADDPELARILGLPDENPEKIFTHLRQMKDNF